jgi:hypothetical protein
MQEQLAITLKPERVTVTAGGTPAQVVAVLKNQTSVIDSYSIEITNLNPDWYKIPDASPALFPNEEKLINITFQAPVGVDVLSGRYEYTVRARSTAVAGRVGQASGTLFVVLPEVLSTRLKRELVRGQEGTFELTVANRSRTDETVVLSAKDAEGLLDFTFDPPAPTVRSGGTQAVNLRVRVVPGQVLLAERAFAFTIAAKTADEREQAKPLEAQFVFIPVQVRMELLPARLKGIEGRFNLNVQNPGTNTVALTAALSATDPEGILDFAFQQRQVTLQPGTALILPLTVRLKTGRKPEVKPYPFTITAVEGGGGPTATPIGQPIAGEFVYEPPIAFDVVVEKTGGNTSAGDFLVKINNPSHTGLRLSLRAQDSGQALDLFFANRVEEFPLEAGGSVEVSLLARLKFAPPAQETRYPFTVTAHAVPDDGSSETDQTATAELVAGGTAGPMLRMDLAPAQMSGAQGRFQVGLTSGVSTPLDVRLRGRDDNILLQYEFEPPQVQLLPGNAQVVNLTVRPRDGLGLDPNLTYDFDVISWVPGVGTDGATTARSGSWTYVPEGPAIAPLNVTIDPTHVLGDRGQFELTLVNQGDAPLGVVLRGSDEADALEFVFQVPRVDLQPKEVTRISVIVQGKGAGTLTGPYRYPFEIAGWVPGTVQSDASVAYGEVIVTEAPKVPSAWNWQRLATAALLLLWMVLPFILDPILRSTQNETLRGTIYQLLNYLPAIAFPALGALLYGSNPTEVRGWKAVVAGWIGFGGIVTYILPLLLQGLPPGSGPFGLSWQPFVYLIMLPALIIILFA